MTSQENVEIVRRAISEFGESQRISETTTAPDFVFDTRTDRLYPEQKEFHGWDGFYEFFQEWIEPYDKWENAIEDVLDAGEDRVVALVHQRGRLRGTQDWLEWRYGLVYTVDRGRIHRIQLYDTPEQALEAAGLGGPLGL